MNISVIIPVSNLVPDSLQERIDTLNFALSNFYGKQKDIEFEIIIVEQSIDGYFYYFDKIKYPSNLNVKIVLIKYSIFNKQWCINIGVRRANGKFLITAEPDMFVEGDDYFLRLVALMETENLKWAFGWNHLYYTNKAEKTDIMKLSMSDMTYDPDRLCEPRRGLSEGGIVIYQRHFFVSVLGYANEWLQGLGGPDNEIAARSYGATKTYKGVLSTVYHMWHQGGKSVAMTHRKKNQNLIGVSRKNPDKVNKFLQSVSPGNVNAPLCKYGEFMNGKS